MASFGPITSGDAEDLERLLAECHTHYYGVPDGADKAAKALISGGSSCETWLAKRDAVALGFATFAILHTGPEGRGTLYLKDLFVSQSGRGARLGSAFISALAREAVARDCIRFDWTAETSNPGAVALYDRIGAARVEEKISYRLTGSDLIAVAKG